LKTLNKIDTWPCLFAIKLVELKKLGGEGAGRQVVWDMIY
jgi:hypothetical protein